MSSRSRILQRLRANRTQGIARQPALPTLAPVASTQDLLEMFCQQLRANQAQVLVLDEPDWCPTLCRLSQEQGVRRLAVHPDTVHARQLQHHAEATGLPFQLWWMNQPLEAMKADLFQQVDASLTRATAGIAATGSLVMHSAAQEPRSLSLVPPLHFVLLDCRQLYADLSETLRQQNWRHELPTNLVLISGPSKTADIQQTLAYGAHGPRQLVVLIESSADTK